MITRIITVIVAASFVASTAFSQMRYSRPKSSTRSPTPTPTPTATPQQRMAPTSAQILPKTSPSGKSGTAQTQQFIPARKATPAPTPPGLAAMQRTVATQQPKLAPTPAPTPLKPTPTPVPPPDVKAYLDRQIANSKDKKFHFTVNGRDLALTPFHVWAQKSTGADTTSTCIDMKSDDGRIYDIDFVTTGPQVTSIRIHKINGESLR